MKKLIVTVMAVCTMASAQPIDHHDDMCSTLQVVLPDLGLNQTTFTSRWVKPAKFPTPSETLEITGDFKITCPDFTLTQSPDGITMSGKDFKALSMHMKSGFLIGQHRGIPENNPAAKPTIGTYFAYFKADASLEFTSVLFGVKFPFVAGYKINGGPITPLVFEGKMYPLPYQRGDTIEIFSVAGPNTLLEYVKIDTKAISIEARVKHPFPDK